jgi:hypothetical protein
MNSHAPEVLRDLATRLRREVGRAEYMWRAQRGELGAELHMLERSDVEAAAGAGVLQIDRALTLELAGTP